MIIQTDCRDLDLDLLSSCDALITDPPYSPHVHESSITGSRFEEGPDARDLGFDAITPEDREWLALAAVLVKRWSVVFSDFEGVPEWWRTFADARALEWVRLVPWVRFSQAQKSGDRPPSGAEAILLWHRMTDVGPRGGTPRPKKKRWNGPGNLTAYTAPVFRGSDAIPGEKPLDLALSIVSHYSDPGELVLDPYAGRGTFGLACRLLDREYLGAERDPVRAALAEARETAPLSPRDLQRVRDWLAASDGDVVPEPTCDAERPTRERFLRRKEDRARVRRNAGLGD